MNELEIFKQIGLGGGLFVIAVYLVKLVQGMFTQIVSQNRETSQAIVGEMRQFTAKLQLLSDSDRQNHETNLEIVQLIRMLSKTVKLHAEKSEEYAQLVADQKMAGVKEVGKEFSKQGKKIINRIDKRFNTFETIFKSGTSETK